MENSLVTRVAVAIIWPAIIAALLLSYAWIGYHASDDANYANAVFYLFDDGQHGSGAKNFHAWPRFPVTLPIAASFGTLGISTFSLALPTALYYFGILSLVFLIMTRATSFGFALVAVVVVAFIPLLWERASAVSADVTECFYVLAGLLALFAALRGEKQSLLFAMVAGLFLGLGYLVRETTVAYCFLIFVLFVFNWQAARRVYFMVGVGFFAILIVDAAILYAATGDPLYRFTSSFGAVQGEFQNAPSWDIRSQEGVSQRFAWYPKNALIPYAGDYLSPIVMLFTNKEVILVTFFGIAAVLAGLVSRSGPKSSTESFVFYFAALFGFAFFLALPNQLALQPRYIAPAVVAFCLASLIQIHHLWNRRYRAVCLILIAAFLGGGFMIVSLSNPYPIFGETTLTSVAKSHAERIHTDPETYRRAGFLIVQDGVKEKTASGLPPASGLFLHNPNRLKGPSQSIGPDQLPAYKVKPGWVKIRTFDPPQKPMARLLDLLRISDFLPGFVHRKIFTPVKPVTLYRVG